MEESRQPAVEHVGDAREQRGQGHGDVAPQRRLRVDGRLPSTLLHLGPHQEDPQADDRPEQRRRPGRDPARPASEHIGDRGHDQQHADRPGQRGGRPQRRHPPPRPVAQGEQGPDRGHQEQRLRVGPHEHERRRAEQQQPWRPGRRLAVAGQVEREPADQDGGHEGAQVGEDQEGDPLPAGEQEPDAPARDRVQREEPDRLLGQPLVAELGDAAVPHPVPRKEPVGQGHGIGIELVGRQPGDDVGHADQDPGHDPGHHGHGQVVPEVGVDEAPHGPADVHGPALCARYDAGTREAQERRRLEDVRVLGDDRCRPAPEPGEGGDELPAVVRDVVAPCRHDPDIPARPRPVDDLGGHGAGRRLLVAPEVVDPVDPLGAGE